MTPRKIFAVSISAAIALAAAVMMLAPLSGAADAAMAPVSDVPLAPAALGAAQPLTSSADVYWDNQFRPRGLDYRAYAMAADGQGKVYFGGGFARAGNITAAGRIARWDGNWSALGSGVEPPGNVNGSVYAMAVSGTQVYVGGQFQQAFNPDGTYTTAYNIALWNGSTWSPLGNGINVFGTVSSIVISGADVYVGGDFFNVYNSDSSIVHANSIARWDGAAWAMLGSDNAAQGNGVDGVVDAMKVSAGNLYVAGNIAHGFNHVGTAGLVTASNVARWNGAGWSALGAGYVYEDNGVNGRVKAITADADGNLYLGGGFDVARISANAPVTVNHIAKWNGVAWAPLGNGLDDVAPALVVSGTDVYAGGRFRHAYDSPSSTVTVNHLARWNGAAWSPLGAGTGSDIVALALSGGDLYAGGGFMYAGGEADFYAARWNIASGTWSGLVALPSNGLNGGASALAADGNNLFAGGFFHSAGSAPAENIARWNGSAWSPLGQNSATLLDFSAVGPASSVSAIAADHQGGVYVGGSFFGLIASGTQTATPNFIAHWNGSAWSTLGSGSGIATGNGLNGNVNAIVVSGTDVYVGGQFSSAFNSNGVTVSVNNIAKWNGVSWSALGADGGPSGNGLDNSVNALLLRNGKLTVGGAFINARNSSSSSITANRLAEWDGSAWSSVGSGGENGVDYLVYALASAGSNLYVGGYFNNAGTVPANNIAKWNSSAWSALGSGGGQDGNGVSGQVYALVANGADVYVGGYFDTAFTSSALSVTVNSIARWNGMAWTPLGSGTLQDGGYRSTVRALTPFGGALWVGGVFERAGDKQSFGIARWTAFGNNSNTFLYLPLIKR